MHLQAKLPVGSQQNNGNDMKKNTPKSIPPINLKKRFPFFIITLTCIIAIFGILSLGIGRYSLNFHQIIKIIFARTSPDTEISETMRTVLCNIRIPRILLALISGAGLSVAGAAFQGLLSNPLATPDTLGVATGASFGAALGILLGLNMIFIQVLAVVFGVVAVIIVYSISKFRGQSSIIMIILAGMVVSALFSALVSVIKYVADPQNVLPSITFWLMGSLSGTNFKTLILGSPFIIIGIFLIYILRWRLNVMSLHEDEARALGVNVQLVRALIIIGSTMITAAVVSMCGLIGWVGLLIPHIARMMFGNNNIHVIPASIVLGALFMLIIDTAARSITAAEIPVSILTAIIGAPFFIILLRKTGGIFV